MGISQSGHSSASAKGWFLAMPNIHSACEAALYVKDTFGCGTCVFSSAYPKIVLDIKGVVL